jgi:Tfp pilus assembly protein PilZ
MEGKPSEIRARYFDGKGGRLQGSIMNISLGGVYVKTPYPLVKGILVVLELADASLSMFANVSGMVVRSDASRGMALEFMDKDNSDIKALLKGIGGSSCTDDRDAGGEGNRKNIRLQLLSNDFQMTNRKKREKRHGDHVKKEKRRQNRKLLRIEARYQDPDSKILKGVLRNISLSGLYIETVNTLGVQAKIHMCLDATDLGKVIDVAGKVVRVDENKGMAIEFDDKENREIRLLLSSLRKLDQASMLALIRSGMGD